LSGGIGYKYLDRIFHSVISHNSFVIKPYIIVKIETAKAGPKFVEKPSGTKLFAMAIQPITVNMNNKYIREYYRKKVILFKMMSLAG